MATSFPEFEYRRFLSLMNVLHAWVHAHGNSCVCVCLVHCLRRTLSSWPWPPAFLSLNIKIPVTHVCSSCMSSCAQEILCVCVCMCVCLSLKLWISRIPVLAHCLRRTLSSKVRWPVGTIFPEFETVKIKNSSRPCSCISCCVCTVVVQLVVHAQLLYMHSRCVP